MSGKSNKTTYVILGITGFGFLMTVACCGGFAFWGWGLFTDQAEAALNRNPIIQRHIGDIEDIDTDFVATGNEENEDVYVFRISGPKGSGTVTAEFLTVDAETEEVVSGTLELSTGETYDLMADVPDGNGDEASP